MTVAVQNLGSMLNQVTEHYTSFEDAMRLANTMAHKDAAGFKEMTDEISEMSKRIPLTREQLAKGLYETVSNGVEEPQWMAYLEQSAKAAYGAQANLEGVVSVTSTIIKHYGGHCTRGMRMRKVVPMPGSEASTKMRPL